LSTYITLTMNKIIEKLRSELKRNSDEKTKLSGERFFKEKVESYGIKTATVIKIGKDFFKEIQDSDKLKIFSMCEELWKSGIIEEGYIACNWSYFVHKKYESSDFRIFERWVNLYISNWATCDTLCNHTIGNLVETYPSLLPELKKWTGSDNRWARRASSVSLIIPARKGKFLEDIFDIATILHSDKDDLVQKGYGWMLKAASQAHQKEVFDYVMKGKSTMPRTALRYAIEKMPPELKAMVMAK
jgi:3-methyladenine DNA glycosylase AlkD